jgi:hypothetical protein
MPGKLGRLVSMRSQLGARLAKTTICGWNTSRSSRLEARRKINSGMAVLVENTGAPQVGQKARVTIFPLSAGAAYSLTRPLSVTVTLGSAMCDECPEPLDRRQSIQWQWPAMAGSPAQA